MKRTVLVFGIIAGLIETVVLIFTAMAMKNSPNFSHGSSSMIIGFGTMIIAFSLIYVAIKNYRDKYNDGLISFGKAFSIGLLISLIASTFYVAVWALLYHFVVPDFMEKYSAYMIAQLKSSKLSAIEIQKKVAEYRKLTEDYKNPLFFALATYTEILPVGLLITLISSLILKRRPNSVSSPVS